MSSYPAPVPCAAEADLKRFWMMRPDYSARFTLGQKLRAIDAARDGACPHGACYVAQGYSLPDGMDWGRVAALRSEYDLPAHVVPECVSNGCAGWGTPIIRGRYLARPGNLSSPSTISPADALAAFNGD